MCHPHLMRAALIALAVLAVAAVLVVGLTQASGGGGKDATPAAITPTREDILRRLEGSPPALAALHVQADRLLPGGLPALRARLKELRGHPAVVNIWASWCGPCNQEAPVLQRVSLARGKRVAFVGVDLKDSRDGARRFLKRFPSSYPSYEDPNGRIFGDYRLAGVPSTVFYDAAGRQAYIHQGPYLTTADLEGDIDRYTLGG